MRKTSVDYDALVVGAGPSGSATAAGIAGAGYRVLLVERRTMVGQPVSCSGLISVRTLNAAGVSSAVVLNSLNGATIHSSSGKQLGFGSSETRAVAIDRASFDRVLAEKAQEAGVELLLDTKLVSIERVGAHITAGLQASGGTRVVTARILVGADGVGSFVAKWIGQFDAAGSIMAIGGEGELAGIRSDRVSIFLGSTFAPGWFGWLIPLGNGRVRIGTGCASGSPVTTRQLMDRMVAGFPEHLGGLKIQRLWSKPIPLYSPIRTFADNILLVGDAARQVKPTSGGGIYGGLVGSKFCSQVATAALRDGIFSDDYLSRYQRAVEMELGPALAQGSILRDAFVSLRDEEVDRILSILNTRFLRNVINRFGDMDFPWGIAEQLLTLLPSLRGLLDSKRRPIVFQPVTSCASEAVR